MAQKKTKNKKLLIIHALLGEKKIKQKKKSVIENCNRTAPWRKTQTAIGIFPPNRQIGIQNEWMVQRVTADVWSANKTRILFGLFFQTCITVHW